MALGFVGDIHGYIGVFRDIVFATKNYPITDVIQVGDFGVRDIKNLRKNKFKFIVPTYFIDGNHEYFEQFEGLTDVTEMYPNLFYVPRGTVLNLSGRNIAFLGGAASIDKKYRIKNGWHWDDRENITQNDIDNLRKNIKGKKIDIFVTHIAPNSIINDNFDPFGRLRFGVGIDWEDPNSIIVEELWNEMGKPFNISGHMHEKKSGENYRILHELEFWSY